MSSYIVGEVLYRGRSCYTEGLYMKLLPLNFPVFYHCVVKDHTNLKQYDAVSVLLLGKRREQCDAQRDVVILDPVAANYVSGKKRIRKEILNPLLLCSVKEAERRLKMLGFQSIEDVVPILKRLLAVSISLSKDELDALQGDYDATGNAYRFVANVFLLSIKCPAKYVYTLTAEDKELIQACYLERSIHQDLIERSGGELVSVHRDDIWNTAPAISFRYRPVTLPKDYQMIVDYLTPLVLDKSALIRLDKATLDSFFSEADENTYIGFFECFGPHEYILQQINTNLFVSSISLFFLQIIPFDAGLEQVDSIYNCVAEKSKQIKNIYAGIIIEDDMASQYQKVVVLFLRNKMDSEHKGKAMDRGKPAISETKMDLFDFVKIYGG